MWRCSGDSLTEQWLLYVWRLNSLHIDLMPLCYLITVLKIGDPDVIWTRTMLRSRILTIRGATALCDVHTATMYERLQTVLVRRTTAKRRITNIASRFSRVLRHKPTSLRLSPRCWRKRRLTWCVTWHCWDASVLRTYSTLQGSFSSNDSISPYAKLLYATPRHATPRQATLRYPVILWTMTADHSSCRTCGWRSALRYATLTYATLRYATLETWPLGRVKPVTLEE